MRISCFKFFVLCVLLTTLTACDPSSTISQLTAGLNNGEPVVLPTASASAPIVGEVEVTSFAYRSTCSRTSEFVINLDKMSFLSNNRTLLQFTLFNANDEAVFFGRFRRPSPMYVTDDLGNRYDFARDIEGFSTSSTTISAGTRTTVRLELPPINGNATRLDFRSASSNNCPTVADPMVLDLNMTYAELRAQAIAATQSQQTTEETTDGS